MSAITEMQPNSTTELHAVALVGAGPGDPDLLTIGGARRLAMADVVVYDRLANPVLLALAPASAERIDVGKTPEHHTLPQCEINQLLIDRARMRKRVVRLKGGDPFVFGRGGEEAQALAAANVPFIIVPGITSAIAAPAYAGIPVTHRTIATSFAVITGHEDPSKEHSDVDFATFATGIDTLVFVMGVGHLSEIAQKLIRFGRAPTTPVAIIERGTTPRQRVIRASLDKIATVAHEAGVASPATIVVGEVVALSDELSWFGEKETGAPASQLR